MNKAVKIILITLLSILAVGVTTVMILFMTGKMKFTGFRINTSVSKTVVFDEAYDKTFNNIKITSKGADIEIKEAVDLKTKVVIYSDYDRYNVNATDNLVIDVKNKKCNFICFNTKISKVVIYLPNTYDKKISVDNDYGDVNVGSFPNAKFNIAEDYGDVKIESSSEVVINNDYGDIRLGTVYNYLSLEDDYGDVKITNALITKDSTINLDYGDVKIENTSDVYIDAKTDMGDIKIGRNNRKSDLVLKIRNDYGDIKVNKK